MAITIPYTWTQGNEASQPGTGFWWQENASSFWAYPSWKALKFLRASGRLLALVAGPVNNGQRSRLRVYHFQGRPETTLEAELATNAAGYVELETDDVTAASFGVRASGILDLFYISGGYLGTPATAELRHRYSQDGGRTWSAAVAQTITHATYGTFSPREDPRSGGGLVSAGGTYGMNEMALRFQYDRQGNLILASNGFWTLAGSPRGTMMVTARPDSSRLRWEYGVPEVASSQDGNLWLQSLRSGHMYRRSHGQGWPSRYTLLPNDAPFTGAAEAGSGLGFTDGGHWFDERTNTLVCWRSEITGAVPRNYRFLFRTFGRAGTGPPWWQTQGDFTEYLTYWSQVFGIYEFFSGASDLLLLGDGSVEFFYLNASQQPELVRCANFSPGAALVWS